MLYRLAFILLFSIVVGVSQAQIQDSLLHHSTLQVHTVEDSVFSSIDHFQSVNDSLSNSINNLDTLGQRQLGQLDSIQQATTGSVLSLKNSYDSVLSVSDRAGSAIQYRIDSLLNLDLPPDNAIDKLNHKLDSVNNWRSEKLGTLEKKTEELRSKVHDKINSLEIPDELKEKATGITSSLDKVDLSLPKDKIPGLESIDKNLSVLSPDGLNLPTEQLNLQGGINNPIGDTSLPQTDGLNIPDTGLNGVSENISQYQNQLEGIPKNADQISQLAESKATQIDEVAGVQGQLGEASTLQESISKANDPEAVKNELKDMAKKEAVNHFAGKEEQLKEAMNKLAEYKKKYSSVQSISDLPKKRPNEMRNKPLIERLVPGVALQIHRRNDWLLDINPYIGYRFNSRLTTGIGWNQRLAYNYDEREFNSELSIYGPRAYGEFKIGKGFSGHLNLEYMKTYVPPLFSSTVDVHEREWVFSTMAGLKKEYKFIKNVKGTLYILYNLHDPHHRSPYGDKLNMRLGFEFPMKKKKKA